MALQIEKIHYSLHRPLTASDSQKRLAKMENPQDAYESAGKPTSSLETVHSFCSSSLL